MLITGRTSADEINVGGAKVSAGVVRDGAAVAPRRASGPHVRGRKAPLVGTMVVADVVLTSGETAASETVRPSAWSEERLPEYGVPRRIKLLDSIPRRRR